MVAYSFKAQFADLVESGRKRQTIRAPRKRHARPGEPIQLYTGMRTKACRKLVEPDPVCRAVDKITIFRDGLVLTHDGLSLEAVSVEELARADGFDDAQDFLAFFDPDHKGFYGYLIKW